MPKKITILGSTGSIGRSALDLVRRNPDRFQIAGLAARSDHSGLLEQAAEFRPDFLALEDEAAASELQGHLALQANPPELFHGPKGVETLAGLETDVVLCAMVGASGLGAILNAIRHGRTVALANKEPMVMAGSLIMKEAQENAVEVLPVDSEHSALFQCIGAGESRQVHRVYLTASGGPFYGRPRDTLRNVTPEQAVNHPTWDMGAKISVDSATLMNKGLEIIEAMWLFDLPLSAIEVLIHPQSIVHGLVEFVDGAILAHMGVPDMRLPIQFALTWPDRVESPVERLDLRRMSALTFDEPDFSEFPCLACAVDAAREGGTATAVLNAANEVAVEAFRNGRIPFLSIAEVVRDVLDSSSFVKNESLDAVVSADDEARRKARACIEGAGVKFK